MLDAYLSCCSVGSGETAWIGLDRPNSEWFSGLPWTYVPTVHTMNSYDLCIFVDDAGEWSGNSMTCEDTNRESYSLCELDLQTTTTTTAQTTTVYSKLTDGKIM